MTYIKTAFHPSLRILTKLSRRAWLFGLTTLLVAFIVSMVFISPSAPDSQSEKLARHYTALLAMDVPARNTEAIAYTLSTVMLEESVVAAAVFTPEGERLAQTGGFKPVPELIKDDPTLKTVFNPIVNNDETVGYLSIIYRPNRAP